MPSSWAACGSFNVIENLFNESRTHEVPEQSSLPVVVFPLGLKGFRGGLHVSICAPSCFFGYWLVQRKDVHFG